MCILFCLSLRILVILSITLTPSLVQYVYYLTHSIEYISVFSHSILHQISVLFCLTFHSHPQLLQPTILHVKAHSALRLVTERRRINMKADDCNCSLMDESQLLTDVHYTKPYLAISMTFGFWLHYQVNISAVNSTHRLANVAEFYTSYISIPV